MNSAASHAGCSFSGPRVPTPASYSGVYRFCARRCGASTRIPSLSIGCSTRTTCAKGASRKGASLPRPQKRLTKGKPKPLKHSSGQSTEKWNFFSRAEFNRPWQVPWGGRETALGFGGWVLSFLLTSLVLLPSIIQLSGLPVQELNSSQKTSFVLLNQLLETGIGIGLIRYLLRNYEPLPEDIFNFDVRHPFQKPNGWLLWAILGIIVAPLLVTGTLAIFSAFGYTDEGRSTVDEVVKIIAPSSSSFYSLLAVTAVLAPLLEEFVFRGFLLTSLTKFMPTYAAVGASSLCFGLAHLSVRDFPELTVLGMLLGFSYVRSRNLLTPIFIHGLWNGTVLLVLFAISQT